MYALSAKPPFCKQVYVQHGHDYMVYQPKLGSFWDAPRLGDPHGGHRMDRLRDVTKTDAQQIQKKKKKNIFCTCVYLLIQYNII